MDITGFTQSPHRTSNSKNFVKLPPLCGSGSNAPFPRKQRSSVKKKTKYGSGIRKKVGQKKIIDKMKHGHITKDEEEVAEALYALATMSSDVKNDNHLAIIDEKPSSNSALEENELKKTGSNINPGPHQHDLLPEKQMDCSHSINEHSDALKQNVLTETTPNGAEASSPKQVTTEHKNHKHSELPSLWNCISGREIDDSDTLCRRLNLKKSLKRCSTHVYVTHLIKILTKDDEFQENSTQLTISGEPVSCLSPLKLNTRQKGGVIFDDASSRSASEKNTMVETNKDTFLHTSPKPAPEISSRQHLGYNWKIPEAFRAPFMHQSLPFSAPKIVYSSSTSPHGNGFPITTQQLQEPQYMIRNIGFSPESTNQFFPQLEKWGSNKGVASTKLSEWENGVRSSSTVMLNSYAQALLPRFYTTTLGSKPQHSSQPGNNNWSAANRDPYSRLLLRNGSALYNENITNLHLPL